MTKASQSQVAFIKSMAVVVQHQVVMTCQQGCFHIPVASHRPAGAPLPNQGHFQGGILVHCKHTNVGQAFKTCSQKISRRGHMENRFYSSILDKLQVVYIVCIFSIYCIICIISALSAMHNVYIGQFFFLSTESGGTHCPTSRLSYY